MLPTTSRRDFLRQTVTGAACLALPATATAAAPKPEPFGPKQIISGKPRERGLAYGKQFKDGIAAFLDKEIYGAFVAKPAPKDEMLRYAAACGKVMKDASPIVYEELGGVAEGSGLKFEELVLITLHEELYHKGALPKVEHCTAVGVAPPDTAGKQTLVGQTWDWMETVAGMSSVVEWRTGTGPSVLAYGFPGMWAGAGLNSNGLALAWTSADLGNKSLGARVGIPSYALIAHLLYQESLDAVVKEVERDRHAGWFTFVMGDKTGRLLSIEGSPKKIHTEYAKGRLFRVGFGTRALTGTPEGKPPPVHARCRKMHDHIDAAAGKVDAAKLKDVFADPKCAISVGKPTIDMMVFDCTAGTAHLSRGPSYGVDWKEYTFGDPK
jgi:hypothetical protein